MSARLAVTLFRGWKSVDSPRDEYPYRFIGEAAEDYGVLDVAIGEYVRGKIPNPTYDMLIDLARRGGREGFERLVETHSGDLKFGRFGSATFQSDTFKYIQFWFISNGLDFIIVEYHKWEAPSNRVLAELQQIVASMSIA